MSFKTAAALAAIFLTSCSRQSRREVERVAVFPIEDLEDRRGEHWIDAALADLIVSETAGATGLYTFAAVDKNAATLRRATRFLQGYRTSTGAVFTLTDLETLKAERVINVGATDIASISEQAARALWPQARPAGSRNPEALRNFGQAVHESKPADTAALLQKALEADPNFSDAAIVLSRVNPSAAANYLNHATPADPLDRARVLFARTQISGSEGERIDAAEKLAQLMPSDEEIHSQLATLYMSQRRFEEAIQAYEKAIRAEPANAELYNNLAYACGYAGMMGEAIKRIDEYAKLIPESANPIDSLGEIYFIAGNFQEAGKSFLTAYEKDPAFFGGFELWKAALAKLASGDRAGASQLFQRYSDAASQNPSFAIQQAQWNYITGDRQKAMESISAFAGLSAAGPGPSAAHSQLAVWRAFEKLRSTEEAEKSFSLARTPQEQRWAMVALALSKPEVIPRIPDSLLREEVAAYSALAQGNYEQAITSLMNVRKRTTPMQAGVWDGLIMWASAELGKPAEKQPWPIPGSGGGNPMESVMWERLLKIKASTSK